MRLLFLIVLICLCSKFSFAQKEKEAALLDKVLKARTDSEKIKALNQLAEFYYIFKLDKKADSVLKSELVIAEISNNKELIFQVLFSDVISNVGGWTSAENFQRAIAFLDKGLNYAKEARLQDYQAIAHIRKAVLFRKRKEFDKALEEAALALSAVGNKPKDSLTSSMYLEMGDIFLDKGDAVSAYNYYNNAYDLSYTIKNIVLQSEAFHRFASLYYSMGNTDLAKENLFKSIELNKKPNNQLGLLKDFIDLAKFTDQKEYIIQAGLLADTLQLDFYILYSKRMMFAYLMVIEKNLRESLDYLEKNSDLKTSFINQGVSNYHWVVGNVYKYCGHCDSALLYYTLAEPEYRRTFNKGNLQTIYSEMAECFQTIGKNDTAIYYYEQSLAISKELSSLALNCSTSLRLSKLYGQTGSYKNAFDYSLMHLKYRDTLNKMGAQRDVTLLEMEREAKKHEKDMEELARIQLNKRNLQYVSISIAIVALFFLLILMGAFPMSKFTIKILGYFSFICLFEFIVLILDTYLHKITHGEPLKIWLIKILVIALLVPFQHFLEHALIRFIESKKLMRFRNNFSIKKMWAKMKKPAHKKPRTGIEEDTAVL